jgi:glycosyltransferase involved in cell wall biosynthesis
MVTSPTATDTDFTHDVIGRYVCNGLDEALRSTDRNIRPDARPFDIIIIGGGTFGAGIAQHLFYADRTHSHRILVLEAGKMLLSEHVQNFPMIGLNVPGPTNADPGVPRLEVWGLPIVGNGIDDSDTRDFRFVMKNQKNEFVPTVLYTGRFVDRKGIRDLLAAIPMVIKTAPSTRFVFVGGQPGSTGEDMERWWLPEFLYPYRSQIKFTGWIPVSELVHWYTVADILVVPSWYEPFGMVILEGMLHGSAIIATNTGGPMEILEHGRTGLLFTPRDIIALSNYIVLLVNNQHLRQQIATAAIKEVREKWSWAKIFEKMLDVYHEVIH